MLYVSGSIGLDPTTMTLAGPGVEAQCEQVMLNLEAILRAAGCSFSDVVKTTILLTDIADFAAVNKIYGARFSAAPPARATYAVAALPLSARVEIEAIAALPNQ
jgi:2-iminobutanoate/2-iminopropanoate deaminase